MRENQAALARLNRKFKRLPILVRERMRKATEESAQEVVAQQRRLAPEDEGRLRQAIMHEMAPAPAAAAWIFVNYAAAKGPSAPYAHLVEFGAAPHTIASSKPMGPGGMYGLRVEHPGAPAQAFFYPGWRMTRAKAKRRISAAARKAIKEIKGGG